MCSQKVVIFMCVLLPLVYGVNLNYYSAQRQSNLECSDPNLQLACQIDCGINPALCVNEECYCISINNYELVRGRKRPYHTSAKSQSLSCNSYIDQYLCQWNCGNQPALCVGYDCYCMSITSDANQNNQIKPNTRDYAVGYDDDNYSDNINESEGISVYASRPTVRHHIAHFCSNLDTARECIKKCLAVGKPAFCGKDHVCYCGHKYENSLDEPQDSKKMYAEFKDMYAKYFGSDNKDTVELE